MERYMYSSRPVWVKENADVVEESRIETAMVKENGNMELRKVSIPCSGSTEE